MKIIVRALLCGILFCSCNDNQQTDGDTDIGVSRTVEVARVTRGMLRPSIEGSGTVKGIQEVWVTAKARGTIDSVTFELGDLVSKGQTLVTLDIQTARYNLQQAREQLRSARLNYNAIEQLAEKQAASEAELANARAQLNAARARFETAREAQDNVNVTAPITGRIADKQPIVTRGTAIAPGAQIARIVDLSRFQVEVPLGEREVIEVESGARVRILPYVNCPRDSQLTGRVTAIAAGADPATGSFTTVITSDDSCGSRLRAGMTVTVRIETTVDSTILIPTSSIVDTNQVFVYDAGIVQRKELILGATFGNRTEVTSGLDTGDVVVITPPPDLSSQDSVDTSVVGATGTWE